MTREDERRLAVVIALLVAAWLAFSAVRGVAQAEPSVGAQGLVGSPTHDWMARACLAETGWHEEACAALVHVMQRRARLRGMTPLAMVRLYSQPMRRRPAGDWSREAVQRWRRAEWKRRITTHGRRPRAFRERASWALTQERFRELHGFVGDVLVGTVPDPCPEALHFAGPAHLDGDAPRGFQRVCAELHPRQRFFGRVPTGGES